MHYDFVDLIPLMDPDMITNKTTHKLTTVKALLKFEDSLAPKARATIIKMYIKYLHKKHSIIYIYIIDID